MRKVLFLLFLFVIGFSVDLSASIEKPVYVVNDTLSVTGSVDSSTSLSLGIYSGSTLVNSTSSIVTGSFNLSLPLDMSEGSYEARLSGGGKIIYFPFKLKEELINYFSFQTTGLNNYRYQSTPHEITSGGEYGGNFTNLLGFSVSGTLYMGNETSPNPNNRYVLIDTETSGEYNLIYKDDDTVFLLYDDIEDTNDVVEKGRNLWEVIDDKVITYVDSQGFFVAEAIGSPTYSPSDTIHLVVITANKTSQRVNRSVTVSLRDPNGNIDASESGTTNSDGYLYLNLTAPSTADLYFVLVNDEPVETVFVKNFELFVQVNDANNNPQHSFRPTGIAKFIVSGKNSDGPVTLSSPSLKVRYPNGTTVTVSLIADGSLYKGKLSLVGLNQGEYGVESIATNNGEVQKARASFSIRNAKPDVMAINLDYVDQFLMINSFGPSKNVTVLITLYNLSKPVGMEKEPCMGGSCIALDDVSVGSRCSDRVSLVEIVNEYGDVVSMGNEFVMNVSEAAATVGEDAPQELRNQCMMIIPTINQSGDYMAVVRMNHSSFSGDIMTHFSVKSLHAFGAPVDSEGNDFGFFKPDGTVRLQLRVKDLSTDIWVNSSQLLDPKLVEVRQVYPNNLDMFEQAGYNKSVANESISNGVLSFTAPSSEGFYEIKFRFKANLSGSIVDGDGNAFLSLKKYFIHGFGGEMYSPGDNVTIAVSVTDADSASWGSSCTGCTGFTANVSRLRNEQTGKVYTQDEISYSSTAITSSSSGLTITIHTVGMNPGWYSIEYTLYDPENPTASYMGWGGFELRNFWVNVIPLMDDGGNLTMNQEGQYSSFDNISFGVMVETMIGPSAPDSVSISSFGLDVFEYVIDVPATITTQGIEQVCGVEGNGCVPMYVVQIYSSATEDEYYRLSFEVTKDDSSDIGTAWIQKASFRTSMRLYPEDRKFKWPVRYSNSETVLVSFESSNDTGKHNLNNVTIEVVFSKNNMMPIKFEYGQNYTTTCSENQCNVSFNLTGFTNEYFVEFLIEDYTGATSWNEIMLRIQDQILAVPQLIQAWSWNEVDLENNFGLWNSEDRCDNNRNLENDQCDFNGQNDTLCLSWVNFTLAENKTIGTSYKGRVFEIINTSWDYGRWEDTNPQGQKDAYVILNGTHLWFDTDEDFTGVASLQEGDSFVAKSINWTIVKIGPGEMFSIKATDKICGSYEICNGPGPCQKGSIMFVPPTGYENFSKYYFGVAGLFWENFGDNEESCNGGEFSFIAFHNKTHIWATNVTASGGEVNANLSAVTPVIKDQNLQLNGSDWKIISLDVEQFTIRSVNRLFSGHYVNISKALNTSTRVKIGEIQEGMEHDKSDFEMGVDFNNDGFTNGSIAFVTMDSTTAGVYDMLGVGLETCNITDYVNVNSARIQRQVGYGENITLLSIGSRGGQVTLYAEKPGEMPWLGEMPSSGIFRVPVIVTMPNGTFSSANVSIDKFRRITESGDSFVTMSYNPNASITGVGEIDVNASELNETGNYFLALIANVSGTAELIKMEDWMWPNVFIRTYFSSTESGQGAYITDFNKSKAYRTGWGMWIDDYYNNTVMWATDMNIEWNPTCDWKEPVDAGSGTNHTYKIWENYWLYESTANTSMVWIKKGSCNFSGVSALNGSLVPQYDFVLNENTVTLRILNATINQTRIGITEFNLPSTSQIHDHWEIVGVNVSGTIIDFVIVNETAGICNAFNMPGCGHAVYVSFDGNFSGSANYSVGENFTPGLYLQYIEPWGGRVQVADTNTAMFLTDRGEDDTNLSYNLYDENVNGIDLNGDGLYTNVYLLMFDDWRNSVAEQTAVMIDDDTHFIPWISAYNSSTSNWDAYDYDVESGEEELWGHLPEGGWYGNIGNDNVSWSIPEATENTLLLFNHGVTPGSTTATFMARIYDFYGKPVTGASVEIVQIRQFGFLSKLLSEVVDYNVTSVINTTTTQGYVVFDLSSSGWSQGEYWIKLNVTNGGISDLIDGWMGVWEEGE
ncbi:MAG: hypothetical protein GOU99_02860 [Candidatus Altiarchaeota archaeon]|nr:hypothetical protein [Candidatus Altiarchaeota archaeon]